MPILVAMFYGLIAGVVGFLVGAFAAAAIASATHMSNMEGAQGYFAAGIGIATAVLAFLVTVVWTLRSRGVGSILGILGGTLGSIVGIAAVGALGIGLYWMSVPHILPRPSPHLEFEIAPPPNAGLPDVAQSEIELQTNRNRMPGYWNTNGQHAGVLAGWVELYYATSQRMVVITLPNKDVLIFPVRLPANPTAQKYRHWSEWQKAEFAAIAGPGQPQRTSAGNAFQIRYQVDTHGL
jgi:hypothetical protein